MFTLTPALSLKGEGARFPLSSGERARVRGLKKHSPKLFTVPKTLCYRKRYCQEIN